MIFVTFLFVTKIIESIFHFFKHYNAFWAGSFLFEELTDDLCIFWLQVFELFLLDIFDAKSFALIFSLFFPYSMFWTGGD